ncbi:MAG: UDP-N-acetylmuramoyl-L-alanyl-D-glutamate--2,6-diaminopimelate ligase [Phycisphaeraceae bacterium]|nr:UDP-N-acetylmuramoyl-L-alanyl-D-glutamate--2,6-diaminopimelate ligase [Phycisphaeraceae bacterium]
MSAGTTLDPMIERGLFDVESDVKLSDLIAGLDVSIARGDPDAVRICDVTEDSRTVMPGSLFVARPGQKSDGRAFVGQACEQGAVAIVSDDPRVCEGGICEPGAHHRDLGKDVAVVVTPNIPRVSALMAERFYGNPSSKLAMVGVTGTNGKTTVVHLIHQIANASSLRCGMIGTVQIDDGREIAPATMTTPPAVEVSRTLATMVEFGCSACAMETSSHALDQGRVAAIRFRIGVFTNLTGDHLDYHKTMENYAAAKAALFESIPTDGFAIVNAEDPAHERMRRDCGAHLLRCVARQLTESERASATWCGVTITARSTKGMELAIEGPWGCIRATCPLIGDHNAMNALQAVAVCHVLGLPKEAIASGLSGSTTPRGRLEPVVLPGLTRAQRAALPTVLVDFAHTDDGLRNALRAVRSVLPAPVDGEQAPRLWVVFGAGGNKDRAKRPRMGRIAAELADIVVLTSDNPRSERPSDIINEIIAGIDHPEARSRVVVHADRGEAIEHAIRHAAPLDIVLIAGKGHETDQELPDGRGGTYRVPFDDSVIAATCLTARLA